MARVLLVDDDRDIREALGQTLELADLAPLVAGSFVEAKDHLTPAFDGVVISDIRMPGRDGFHLLDYALKTDPDLPVILLTGEADVPMAVRAMSAGAYDFLEKPCAPSALVAVAQRALKARALVLENRRLKAQIERGDAAARLLHGQSARAEELRAQARAIAAADTEALIQGAPGTGTSKVAEVIHLLSPRARAPFVKRAAGGMTPADLDAALEEAGAGTLYLDEITALPPPAQMRLLERLEAGRCARVLASSARDCAAASASGALLADLYYRIDHMRLRMPELRERPEDIPILFRHYVALAAEQANLPAPEVTGEHAARLMAQDWPGNARALMNAAMRFVLGVEDGGAVRGIGLAEQMAQVERALLVAALQRTGGHASQAASDLHLPRKTFYDKLARHGLRAEDYRVDGQDVRESTQ